MPNRWVHDLGPPTGSRDGAGAAEDAGLIDGGLGAVVSGVVRKRRSGIVVVGAHGVRLTDRPTNLNGPGSREP